MGQSNSCIITLQQCRYFKKKIRLSLLTGRGLTRMAWPPGSVDSKCPMVDPSVVDVFAACVAALRY